MPKKDTVNFDFGGRTVSQTCVNINFSVGGFSPDGNGQADILLVQALFNYIQRPDVLGLSRQSLPVIDGQIGQQTRTAILSFQHRNRHRLLSVDGIIHPANYDGRVVKLSGRLMTITLLDNLAIDEARMRNDADHIAGLVKLEPRLAPWLV